MQTLDSETPMNPKLPLKKRPERPPSKEGSSRHVQEKVMLTLGLVFLFGVLCLMYIPEPYNHIGAGVTTFLSIYFMYKFA